MTEVLEVNEHDLVLLEHFNAMSLATKEDSIMQWIAWNSIKDETLLYHLQVDTAGYGVCQLCAYPRPLHVSTTSLSDETLSSPKLCWNCLGKQVVANLDTEWIDGYRFGAIDLASALFPMSLAPTHDEPRARCVNCSKVTLNSSEYPGSEYHLVYALHRDGKTKVPVHTSCSFPCRVMNCTNVASSSFDLRTLNNTRMCVECFDKQTKDEDVYNCNWCNEYNTWEIYYSETRDTSLCESCYYDGDWDCDNCGRTRHGEDPSHDCYYDDDYTEAHPRIFNYSFKPNPIFFGEAPFHMGIELEVEDPDDDRSNLNDQVEWLTDHLGNHAYLKEDGSLGVGFEIVSHPHSLEEFHKLDWSFLKKLQRAGVRSWNANNCGLHVHISNKAFVNTAHEARFTKFIYDNERQVTRIAGRTSSYASFSGKGNSVAKIKHKNQGWDRYQAVNVNNPHTLEVRVFRGSLRKERVLSAIEFVHAVAEYTRSMKVSIKDSPFSWTKFVGYVAANADTYPNLFIIINELFEATRQPIVEDGEQD